MLIKHFNSPLSAGILAVIFVVTAHFFLSGYGAYQSTREKRDALEMRLRIARQQQSQAMHKKQVYEKVSGFLGQAESLGMMKKDWSVYDIHIEEPVTRKTLAQILDQCQNSSSYYFKPIAFHAKAAGTPDAGGEPLNKSYRSGDSPDPKPDEVLLTLTGAFIVKEE